MLFYFPFIFSVDVYGVPGSVFFYLSRSIKYGWKMEGRERKTSGKVRYGWRKKLIFSSTISYSVSLQRVCVCALNLIHFTFLFFLSKIHHWLESQKYVRNMSKYIKLCRGAYSRHMAKASTPTEYNFSPIHYFIRGVHTYCM